MPINTAAAVRRSVAVVVAIVASAALTLGGVESASASPDAFGSSMPISRLAAPTPPAPAPHFHHFTASDFSAQASKLSAALVAAVHRDLGETGAQYLARAAAATSSVDVVKRLKARGVHVLGSHLTGTTLTINVASSADAAAVTAAGATAALGAPTPFDSSDRVLRAAVSTVNILGGSGIWFEDSTFFYKCSVGFNGSDITSGNPQLLTAGHCFSEAGPLATPVRALEWTTPDQSETEPQTGAVIGAPVSPSVAFDNGDDHALVAETGSTITESDKVSTWGGAAVSVVGESAAVVGADLCKSGARTGWTCGTVLAVDEHVGVQADDLTSHDVNSVIATTCVLPGDSGGSAMTGNFAVGVTSASTYSSACSETGQFSAFYTMVSSDGDTSVASSLTQWELGVELSTPVVTSITSGGAVALGGSIAGTLANSSTDDHVCLYVDSLSTTPSCGDVAGDGSWSTALPDGTSVGSHSYFVQATYGQHSKSSTGTGTFVIPEPSTITGRVTDTSDSGLDGFVDVYSDGGSGANASTFVGEYPVSDGDYSVPNLLVGSYRLAFVASSGPAVNGDDSPAASSPYVTQWYSGAYSYATATAVGIDTAGQTVPDINASLENPTFSDVSDPTSSVYTYIQWMASTGVSTGTPNPPGKPLYKPSASVSRQAMASFLFKLSGQTFSAPSDPTFADVDSSNPFDTAIEWMAAQGISTGTVQPSGKPLYKPTDPVSRQAMALFLARYDHVDLSTPPTTQSFADVPLDASSAAAIGWMASTGISTGTAQPSGLPLYKPSSAVSRSAMAAFLYRLAHLPPS